MQFAAEFVEKRLFKDLLKKLQEAVKQVTVKNDLTEEFVQLLTKEILSVDLDLLVKVKAAKDVAGKVIADDTIVYYCTFPV